MTDAPLRPKDVCDRLGVPATTLRLWSVEFAPYLSPGAQPATTERGTTGHRRYREADVDLFRRVQALLAADLTYDEVRRRLAGDESPTDAPSESTTGDPPAIIGDPAGELLDLLRRSVALQDAMLAEQRRTAAALERLATPSAAPGATISAETMNHTRPASETPQGPQNDATAASWRQRLRRWWRGEHG